MGNVGSGRWSPDGNWIVFDGSPPTSKFTNIFVVGAQGGPLRRVTDDSVERMVPAWSHDGRWIYYTEEHGSLREASSIPVEGGSSVQVSATEMFDIVESENGEWLYYTRPRTQNGIYRRRVGGGPPETVAGTENLIYRFWDLHRSALYLLLGGPNAGFASLTGGRAKPHGVKLRQLLYGPRGMTAAPDGSSILYTQEDLTLGDIMMNEIPVVQ